MYVNMNQNESNVDAITQLCLNRYLDKNLCAFKKRPQVCKTVDFVTTKV